MKAIIILVLLGITLSSCNNMDTVDIPLISIDIIESEVTVVENETITINVGITPTNSTETLYYSYSTTYLDVSMANNVLTIIGKKVGSSNVTIKNETESISTSITVLIIPKQYAINEPIVKINGLSANVESIFHRRSSTGEIYSNSSSFPDQILLIAKIVFENNSTSSEYVSSSYFGLTNGYHQINTITYTYNYDQNGNFISTNVSQTIQPGARYTMYIGFEPTDISLLLEDDYNLNFAKSSLSFIVKFIDEEIE